MKNLVNDLLLKEVKEIEDRLIKKGFSFCKITSKIINEKDMHKRIYELKWLMDQSTDTSITFDLFGNVIYKNDKEGLNYIIQYNVLDFKNFIIETDDLVFEINDELILKKYKNIEIIQKEADNIKKVRIDVKDKNNKKTRGMYRFDFRGNNMVRENYYSSKGNRYNRIREYHKPYSIVYNINDLFSHKHQMSLYGEISQFENNINSIMNIIGKNTDVLPGFERRFKMYNDNVKLYENLNKFQIGLEEQIHKVKKLRK